MIDHIIAADLDSAFDTLFTLVDFIPELEKMHEALGADPERQRAFEFVLSCARHTTANIQRVMEKINTSGPLDPDQADAAREAFPEIEAVTSEGYMTFAGVKASLAASVRVRGAELRNRLELSALSHALKDVGATLIELNT